jgi:hypothetical protein
MKETESYKNAKWYKTLLTKWQRQIDYFTQAKTNVVLAYKKTVQDITSNKNEKEMK